MSTEEQGQLFVKKIGASVMAITGGFYYVDEQGNDVGELQTFAVSGFAMSFDDRPVLVTAGHVIKDVLDPIIVHNNYRGHRLRLVQVNLIDCFGEHPKYKGPTPFPEYSNLPRAGIDQATIRDSQGLDFGVIDLPSRYWLGFGANDRRVLAENMWAEEGEKFDVYKMVGIPAEPEHAKNGQGRIGVYSCLEATDPDVPTNHDGKPVWFVGTMPMGVSTVAGVSGGPIFGMRKIAGGWEYKVVAMQSWQVKGKHGLIYGTPLRSFGPIISAAIKSLDEPDNG